VVDVAGIEPVPLLRQLDRLVLTDRISLPSEILMPGIAE